MWLQTFWKVCRRSRFLAHCVVVDEIYDTPTRLNNSGIVSLAIFNLRTRMFVPWGSLCPIDSIVAKPYGFSPAIDEDWSSHRTYRIFCTS